MENKIEKKNQRTAGNKNTVLYLYYMGQYRFISSVSLVHELRINADFYQMSPKGNSVNYF